MSLPNLLIIGAMKAGTTSLHHLLAQHPDIFMSETKELNFFNTSLNWSRGMDWYKSQFDPSFKIRGEASPIYSKWEGIAERIYTFLPETKLIYILRHPVSRFVSQCNHLQVDPNDIVADIKKGKTNEIYTTSLYAKWYAEYLNFFPKQHILLLTSEELRQNEKQVLTGIFEFLDVKPEKFDFEIQKLNVDRNVTEKRLVASKKIQNLNRNKGFIILKSTFSGIIPILKPIWNKIFYKKKKIKSLTTENQKFISQKFNTDLETLKRLTGRQFYTF